jgi:hypothetical protein
MAGVGLVVGLNHVDPNGYAGWEGRLRGCLNDAASMYQILQKQGFSAIDLLLDEHARSDKILASIDRASQLCQPGDLFVFTYSGHGGQLPDPWGERPVVSTLCAFDRQVISHELFLLWSQFKPGCRILMVSDSCHSGTVSRNAPNPDRLPKSIPDPVQVAAVAQRKYTYSNLLRGLPRLPLSCPVLLLSGCQDEQTSLDGVTNGLFTEKLLWAWNGGEFPGNYAGFHQLILTQMPSSQTPNYFLQGPLDDVFPAVSRPFKI